MACRKMQDETAGAAGPSRFDWSSRLEGGKIRTAFPIRVLHTTEGEMYVFVSIRGSAGPRMEQKSYARLIGPLDCGKPLREQLEGVGPGMVAEQERGETQKAVDSMNSLSEKAFIASVDLSDMLNNEALVLAAMKSRDRQALERACPNPYLMARIMAD